MLVISREKVEKAQARKLRIAFWMLIFTGQPSVAPHPYLRSFRLVWSSSAKPGSIVALHRPFNY